MTSLVVGRSSCLAAVGGAPHGVTPQAVPASNDSSAACWRLYLPFDALAEGNKVDGAAAA